MGAGLYELNDPYFNLYRGNLASIERWTRENMKDLPGGLRARDHALQRSRHRV